MRRVGGYNLDEFVPGRAVRKRRIDFNLARLLVGSEGTLGLTVEAKLNLVELPRARATLVVEFAGLLEALAATPLILRARSGRRRSGGPVRARFDSFESRGESTPRLPAGRSRRDLAHRDVR